MAPRVLRAWFAIAPVVLSGCLASSAPTQSVDAAGVEREAAPLAFETTVPPRSAVAFLVDVPADAWVDEGPWHVLPFAHSWRGGDEESARAIGIYRVTDGGALETTTSSLVLGGGDFADYSFGERADAGRYLVVLASDDDADVRARFAVLPRLRDGVPFEVPVATPASTSTGTGVSMFIDFEWLLFESDAVEYAVEVDDSRTSLAGVSAGGARSIAAPHAPDGGALTHAIAIMIPGDGAGRWSLERTGGGSDSSMREEGVYGAAGVAGITAFVYAESSVTGEIETLFRDEPVASTGSIVLFFAWTLPADLEALGLDLEPSTDAWKFPPLTLHAHGATWRVTEDGLEREP